jgi:hypothetical protein
MHIGVAFIKIFNSLTSLEVSTTIRCRHTYLFSCEHQLVYYIFIFSYFKITTEKIKMVHLPLLPSTGSVTTKNKDRYYIDNFEIFSNLHL